MADDKPKEIAPPVTAPQSPPAATATDPPPPQPQPPQTQAQQADKDKDEDIPHYTAELYRHTLLRGANAGSLLVLVLGTPYMLYTGTRCPAALFQRLGRATLQGTTVGAALSGAGTYYTIRNNAEEQIYDRSYRLRYNRGQCYMDQVTYGGVLGGLVLGAALVPASRLMGGLYGASMGFGLAVPTQVATSSHFVAKDKEEKK